MRDELQRNGVRQLTFDSLEDLAENTTREHGSLTTDSFYSDFYGCSLRDAKEYMIKGWPEGQKKISQFKAKLEHIASRSILKNELVYDVTGLDFDMGLVMSGSPEVWYDFSPKEEQRVISIGYSVTVSGSLSAEVIATRGAAIAALIDILEANNVRVELDVFAEIRYHGQDIHIKVPVKAASQATDIDRIAFCLMHNGFTRQMMFSQCSTRMNVKDSNIPWPYVRLDETLKAYDIAIGGAHVGENASFKNANDALKWIKEKLVEFGVRMESGGGSDSGD